MNLDDVKHWAVVSHQGVFPSVCLSKVEFDWLVEQAEKLEKLDRLQEKTANNLRKCRNRLKEIKELVNRN
ncbi:hypothetical protein KDN24_06680 [Bacillus sp. Bva_UNVM-123]|uniref:hypothetical protein n=1 Tax=Bacillus sp. Bva_UNVM-123 TaxID=2829798 RepID=UPI00391EE423